ncbi:MAG: hypothetical protein VXW97_01580 [Pseudomonadota bacterium]|nr:hypothetical protein [Pseudomonadota bacterium]
MDDSVIKVLRRNGSWEKSKDSGKDISSLKSKSVNNKIEEQDFKLDEKFKLLANEIKKRMNTKESFKNDIIKVKTVSKIEKPINTSRLRDTDRLKAKILPYLKSLEELIAKRQSYLNNISDIDKELDQIYKDISSIKEDYLSTIKQLKKNINFFDDSLDIIKCAKEEK